MNSHKDWKASSLGNGGRRVSLNWNIGSTLQKIGTYIFQKCSPNTKYPAHTTYHIVNYLVFLKWGSDAQPFWLNAGVNHRKPYSCHTPSWPTGGHVEYKISRDLSEMGKAVPKYRYIEKDTGWVAQCSQNNNKWEMAWNPLKLIHHTIYGFDIPPHRNCLLCISSELQTPGGMTYGVVGGATLSVG